MSRRQSAAKDIGTWQEESFGQVETVERACPLCRDDNCATPPSRFSLGRWVVKDCATCGFTYITSAPVYGALSETMSWEKSAGLEAEWREATWGIQNTLDRRTRWRMRLFPRKKMPALLARFARPGPVVDLGCGQGAQLEGLAEGFVPHGIEISAAAAAKADRRFSQRGGHAVAAPCLEGLRAFPDGHFTGATLRSYLEHELHPSEVLSELHRVMADDGVVIVKVPNYGSWNRRLTGKRWCGFRHPDHLNYFTPASLAEMARRCGFSAWQGLGWRLPTSDNMWAILRKQAIPR
ncbi:MAG: class I SAM-dependent methyltransferase [Tistlia sp.]|uniref:class I SAM-dependent methyltransferase n=1 Tax=Tistlia sp. TaxID=3057121 RepID=UPI0034A2FC49